MNSDFDQQLADLLVQGRKGDQLAYEKFLSKASEVLRRYLSKRMGDSEMLEDVLQDSLLTIHRARHTFLSGKPMGPWIYAICAHRMTDFFRRVRRVEATEVSLPDYFEQIVESVFGGSSKVENDRGDLVRDALGHLPEKQRLVIELLKVQDFSVREVAAQTGMSESAVKVTAFRGYETIRRSFGVKKK